MAQERADGRFYCTGGIVRQIGLLFAECRILLMQRNQVTSPGFYMLGDILNKSMQVLHDPVPDFNKKLLLSVEVSSISLFHGKRRRSSFSKSERSNDSSPKSHSSDHLGQS